MKALCWLLMAIDLLAQPLVFQDRKLTWDSSRDWLLLASSNLIHWRPIAELPPGGSFCPQAKTTFYRGLRGFLPVSRTQPRMFTMDCTNCSEPTIFFTAFYFDSLLRSGTNLIWRNNEEWDGGDWAYYTWTVGPDFHSGICPTGGFSRFRYAAPQWHREVSERSPCDWALYPGLGAQFTLQYTIAAITNGDTVVSEANIAYSAGVDIGGDTNRLYTVEISARAVECRQDEGCAEWYPVDMVNPCDLRIAGRSPHYTDQWWAIWQWTDVPGGALIDVTPFPPHRPHYWFLGYVCNRIALTD